MGMTQKIICCLATLVTIGHAGIIHAGPNTATVAVAQPAAPTDLRAENYDLNPRYSFSYSVADGLTGDNKAQEETRNGDVVQGRYSLIEPDGSRRIVSYAADPINGFNAVVQKDPSITVKTALRPAVVTSSVIARPASILAGPPGTALAVRPQAALLGAPLIRQELLSGPTLATTNVLTAANTGLLGLGLGLGLRQGSLYSTQALLAAGAYGTGGILKVH